MSCHGPPGEDVDDDDREFLEAAQEDVALAANLLMCLSRRETYVPWWRPQEPPPSVASPSTVTGGGVVDFHRTLCNWGCRRWRSRGIAREGISTAKMEDARRASPTTPLSWSGGGSGTSGSVCEDGWGVQPRPQKRQMERSLHEQGESSKPPDSAPGRPKAELQNGAETVQPSPSKRPKSEGSENGGEDRAPASTWMKTEAANVDAALRVFIPLEPSAVRSSPVAGSNKVRIPRLLFPPQFSSRRYPLFSLLYIIFSLPPLVPAPDFSGSPPPHLVFLRPSSPSMEPRI